MNFGPTYLRLIAEGKETATPSEVRGMAQHITALETALRRLLSVAEDYEHDEFVADACAEARVALGRLAGPIPQVGAVNEQSGGDIEKEVHSRVEHWRSSVERLQEERDHMEQEWQTAMRLQAEAGRAAEIAEAALAEAAEVIAPFAKSARSFPASIYGTDRVHMRADLAPRLVDLRRAQEWFDKHGGSNG